MPPKQQNTAVPIESRIYMIRFQRVVLDESYSLIEFSAANYSRSDCYLAPIACRVATLSQTYFP